MDAAGIEPATSRLRVEITVFHHVALSCTFAPENPIKVDYFFISASMELPTIAPITPGVPLKIPPYFLIRSSADRSEPCGHFTVPPFNCAR